MSSPASSPQTRVLQGSESRTAASLWRRILDTAGLIVRTSRWLLLLVIVCQLVDALSSVAIAYVAKRLIDAVVTMTKGGSSQPLFWVGLEGVLVLMRALSTHASTYVQIVLRARFSLRASQLVLEKACRIAYPHFESPEFVNKIKQVRQ